MLSRWLTRTSSSNLRCLQTLITSSSSSSTNKSLPSFPSHPSPFLSNPNFTSILKPSRRCFSSNNRNNNGGGGNFPKDRSSWKPSPDNDDEEEGYSIFGEDDSGGDFSGFADDEINEAGFDDHNINKQPVKPSSVRRSSSSNVHVPSWAQDSSSSSTDIFADHNINNEQPVKPVRRSSSNVVNVNSWGQHSSSSPSSSDIFADIEKEIKSGGGGGKEDHQWETAEGYKPWGFEEDQKTEVFDFEGGLGGLDEIITTDTGGGGGGGGKNEADLKLEKEIKELSIQLEGPKRAFGDLIAASGITDAMLDSLIALKDLAAVDGLPPLSVIEEMRYQKSKKTTTKAEIERQRQEEIAKSRVRRVDDKGRAYGTGRRKCSVARVFIQPGEGKFLINDKQFDVYFPILDHRADLLRPFSETKTLGFWDVKCTVKGGGTTGQVGAIRLGISRALQNWEPGLRQPLRAEGFLTRDSRVVERKKPGKAKARKSFQWVKR